MNSIQPEASAFQNDWGGLMWHCEKPGRRTECPLNIEGACPPKKSWGSESASALRTWHLCIQLTRPLSTRTSACTTEFPFLPQHSLYICCVPRQIPRADLLGAWGTYLSVPATQALEYNVANWHFVQCAAWWTTHKIRLYQHQRPTLHNQRTCLVHKKQEALFT